MLSIDTPWFPCTVSFSHSYPVVSYFKTIYPHSQVQVNNYTLLILLELLLHSKRQTQTVVNRPSFNEKKKVSFTCPSPSPLIQSVSPSPQPVSMCICLDLDSIKRGTVLSRADVRYSFLQGKRTHRTAKLIDDWDDDPRRLSPPFDQDLSDPSGFKPSPFYSLAATLCKIDLSKSLRTFLLCLVNPGAVGSKNFLEFKVLSCIVLPQPRSISVDHAVPDSTVV